MFAPSLAFFLIAVPHAPIPEEPSSQPAISNEAAAELPSGKWRVDYANGVTEICTLNKQGAAVVTEPVRIVGRAAVSGSAILLLFENGRAQRWTPIGNRFVVEHWFPGDKFPTTAASTLGIAEPVTEAFVRLRKERAAAKLCE